MNGLVNDSAYEHPDWAAFVRAIRANPADNLVRKVAADWLEERGNAARAGLIRMQCDTNAKPIVGRPGLGLTAAVRGPGEPALLTTDGRDTGFVTLTITPKIPHASLTIDRGFVVAAELPWDEWLKLGDWLLQREPVVRVTFTTRPTCEIQGSSTRHDIMSLVVAKAISKGRTPTFTTRWMDLEIRKYLSDRWPDVSNGCWAFPEYPESAHRQRPSAAEVQRHLAE